MIRNYLKTAFRSLRRNKGYSLINILGLTVSLTASFLIIFWIRDELNIDKFHDQHNQIFRVLCNIKGGDSGILTRSTVPYPMIDHLESNFPEVDQVAAYDPTNKKNFSIDEKLYLEDGIYANANFFEVFSFPLLTGRSDQIFNDPNAVVISEELAKKLFGINWQDRAINHAITINGNPNYKVTGVFENISSKSSMSFSFVINLEDLFPPNEEVSWNSYDVRLILKFSEHADIPSFSEKISPVIENNQDQTEQSEVILQPFSRMYLHGNFEDGREAGGRIEYVRLFGFAVLFLMLIACINFMNLATAQASQRAKEIGIRKTIGAGKGALITQFMTEAGLITMCSVGLSITLGNLLLPAFQNLSGRLVTFDYYDPKFWFLILTTAMITTLLAGSYPAIYFSSIGIGKVLKGKLSFSFNTNGFRRGLVVFQFILSVLLIIGSFAVRYQVHYISHKNLGLNKENVLYFRTPPEARNKLATFKEELSQVPGIRDMTFTNGNPLSIGTQVSDLIWEGMNPNEALIFNVLIGDDNLLSTLDIPLSTGRDFNESLSSDTTSFLINETARQLMKLDDPLNSTLKIWNTAGPIVGVVQDFHIASLHEAIGPLIIANMPGRTRLTVLRIDPGHTGIVIPAVGQIFDQFSGGFPFRFDFLDDRYMQMYQSELQIGKLSIWFAAIALIISCLGLFGLSAFVVQQKMKEISIRKVLGATTSSVVSMLTRDFIKWVVLALIIGLPIGWYFTNNWLETFAYRVNLSWWIFLMAGGISIVVAVLTVGILSTRAALNNPVNSLKEP